MKISIQSSPILHNCNSIGELRARKKENQDRAEILYRTDLWRFRMGEILLLNDTKSDFAQHDKNLVIIDEEYTTWPDQGDRATKPVQQNKSAEIRLVTATCKIESALIEQEGCRFEYRQDGDTETFVETSLGVVSRVIVDHKNQTLTWE